MSCALCGSQEKVDIGSKGQSFFVQCTKCHLIRIEPHPSDEALKEYYRNYVYQKRVEKPSRKSLRYKMKIFPLTFLHKGKGERFLDIGCNVGNAVEAARRLGLDGYGIDVSPSAISNAKLLFSENHYFNETLEEFSCQNLKFDFVFCTEVIEHVRDIHSFMGALKSILNPGAVLFFTTPDTGHFRVPRRDLLKWKELRSMQHVTLFNKKNISALFRKYGIRPIFFYPMHRANMRFYSRNES